MTARLHFSNSLEALAERLRENLAAESRDPFSTPAIATPASALRDWLKIRLAERSGIAVNLAFPPLETLLWERIAERDKLREAPDRQPARLLDTFSFQGLVLARLRRDPPEALTDYLASPHSEDAARRLTQLSGQLASLFREYEYNRVAEHGFPGLAESWMQGQTVFERHLLRGNPDRANGHATELRALETWQLDVYHSLFRPGDGLRDRWGAASKTYRYTLPQYAELALKDPATPQGPVRTYHLFGLSNISPFHRDLIGRLADGEKLGDGAARFEIYALNPCAEFWEDALTLRERRARGPRVLQSLAVDADRVAATRPDADESAKGEIRDVDEENGLLALFGKPGRETIKLWCQLTEHDFREDFKEPAPASLATKAGLLHAVQYGVLHRMGPLEPRQHPHPDDRTLRFGAASDPRAELEAVRAEISEALATDTDLRPEDIAIIPADLDASLPLLRAVFAGEDRAPGNVPVLMPDGGAGEGSLLDGLRALLDGCTREITREAALALLENPAVLRATGLNASRLPAVASLLEDAGFARGWGDARDPVGEGASTLVAARNRVRASLVLDADDPAWEDASMPYRPVAGLAERLDAEELGALLDWLDRVLSVTLPLRDRAERPFAEWARKMREARATLFEAGPADARDDLELRRFFDELEAWDAWDGPAIADTTLITMLFADRFRAREGTARSSLLRGGVRVGSLASLRGIPFRRVWITGMTAAFPASSEAMPLDLRAFRRLPGESDPAARDLYALLEVLASCTDAVSLSWHRHGVDGKERQPSRALTGMMAWIESDVLAADVPFGFAAMKRPSSPPPPRADLSPVAFAEEVESTRFHKFRDVADFLRNPVVQEIRHLMRKDEGKTFEDRETDPSEDLFLDRWTERDLLDACLRADLTAPGSAGSTFDRLWTTRRQSGLIPRAPWSEAEEIRLRDALEARLQGEAAALRDLMERTGLRFVGSLRLGPQGLERAESPVHNLPAFRIKVQDGTAGELQLGGILPAFFRGPEGWALRGKPDDDLTGYLIQLCVAGCDLPLPLAEIFAGTGRLLSTPKDGKGLVERILPALDPADARKNLRDLLEDFSRAERGEGHLEDVPLVEITSVWEDSAHNPDGEGQCDWAEDVRERRADAEEQGNRRIDRDERRRRAVDPEIPDALAALVRRRVLPYLRWKENLDLLEDASATEDAT